MHDKLKRAFRPLHLDGLPFDVGGDAGDDRNGFLPTRDIILPSSEHREENFAAHIRVTRVVVSHNSLRCRQHRNAETVPSRAAGSSPEAYTRRPGFEDPLDFADNRLAIEIFQFDLKLVVTAGMLDRRIAADITLGLEHFENVGAPSSSPGVETLDFERICALRMRVMRSLIGSCVDMTDLLTSLTDEAGNKALSNRSRGIAMRLIFCLR